MLKRIALLILTSLTLAGFSAAATEIKIVETCRIDESLKLQEPTQIFCAGDLIVADGVEILTEGHGLQIVSVGNVHFGSEDGLGLQIGTLSAPVFIYARTASGHLAVKSMSDTVDMMGSNVEIEYGSSHNYTQTIEPGYAAEVHMVVAGQKLQLEGRQHRLPL